MRYHRYCCHLCNRLYSESHLSNEKGAEMCSECAGDHLQLVHLYNEILQFRPQYRSLTLPQLFRRMWESIHTESS
jgi:hypothetical protein